jgi:tRNA modification GTPase
MTEEDRRELATLSVAHALTVYTKSDLARAPQGALEISATTDRGIAELLERLDAIVRENFAAPEASLVNERQRQAVAGGLDALSAARASLDAGLQEQMILVDLYRASTSIGLLTGAITREEIFDEIFSKFCIGK